MRSVFTLWECLLDSPSEGRIPADIGVVGLVTWRLGDLASGNGNDAELRRASSVILSSGDGRLTSIAGGRALEPEDEEGRGCVDRGVLAAGDFAADLPGDFVSDFVCELPA